MTNKSDLKTVPEHVAIVMDGNGRWASARGLPRKMGHKAGVETTKKITREAHDLGVKYLTLFGFSTENWKRPADEVNELMRLLRVYIKAETADLHKNNVRLRMIGFKDELADDLVDFVALLSRQPRWCAVLGELVVDVFEEIGLPCRQPLRFERGFDGGLQVDGFFG